MEIFITGVTGYIGFNVARAFRRAGHQVWGLTRSTEKAVRLEKEEVRPVSGDARMPDSYTAVAAQADVLIHAADRQWVMRADDAIQFWVGEMKPLWDGLMLIRGGGHFEGGTVLHWPAGAEGRGALLSGDILQVASDRRYVSFMYSYPNLILLPAHEVRRIATAVKLYECDQIYGAWGDRVVKENAKTAIARSAERYIQALEG